MTSDHSHTTVYEGLQIRTERAPLLKRILAYAIDLGIIYAVIYVAVLIEVLIFAALIALSVIGESLLQLLEGEGDTVSAVMIILVIFGLLLSLLMIATLYHGYFIYYEYKRGITPGKRLFGLQVVTTSGERLTLGQCVLRDLFRYIDALLVLPGLISILANDRGQRLGDLVAGTLVVHSPSREHEKDCLYLSQQDLRYLSAALPPKPVSQEVCEEFLAFAAKRFITGKIAPDLERDQLWLRVAKKHLPPCDHLEQEVVLRYFAETCFQDSNS